MSRTRRETVVRIVSADHPISAEMPDDRKGVTIRANGHEPMQISAAEWDAFMDTMMEMDDVIYDRNREPVKEGVEVEVPVEAEAKDGHTEKEARRIVGRYKIGPFQRKIMALMLQRDPNRGWLPHEIGKEIDPTLVDPAASAYSSLKGLIRRGLVEKVPQKDADRPRYRLNRAVKVGEHV